MKVHINEKVFLKHCWVFRCTPCFSDQSIYICPEHSTCMIDVKKWIIFDFFKLSLSSNRTPRAFKFFVDRVGKKFFYNSRVKFMVI